MLAADTIVTQKTLLDELFTTQNDKREALHNLTGQVREKEHNIEMTSSRIQQARADIESAVAETGRMREEIKAEMADLTDGLTGHLINYSRMTGTNVIEDEDGKELRISHKVSVKSGQMRLF